MDARLPLPPTLSTFLRPGEDAPLSRVLHALAENETSTALQLDTPLEALGGASAREVCVATLSISLDHVADLTILSLAWSRSGNVLMAALGKPDAREGDPSRGAVAAWNLARSDPQARGRPQSVVALDASVTCLAPHPRRKQIVAAGTLTGDVYLLDVSATGEDDRKPQILTRTAAAYKGHLESVAALVWTPSLLEGMRRQTKDEAFVLRSFSADAQCLAWSSDGLDRAIARESLTDAQGRLVGVNRAGVRGGLEMLTSSANGTSMATATTTTTTAAQIAVVSEVGHVLTYELPEPVVSSLGATSADPPAGSEGGAASSGSHRIAAIEQRAPKRASGGGQGHMGPGTAVDWASGAGRDVFLTAGEDGRVLVWAPGAAGPRSGHEPVLSFAATRAPITAAQWSPFAPGVVAVGDTEGATRVFDLARGVRTPVLTIVRDLTSLEEAQQQQQQQTESSATSSSRSSRSNPQPTGRTAAGSGAAEAGSISGSELESESVRAVAFNPRQAEYLAVATGCIVQVWALPPRLSRPTGVGSTFMTRVALGERGGEMGV